MASPAVHPTYITVKEAARRAKVDESTVCRWANRNFFDWRQKDLRKREIDERSFDEFLSRLRSPVRHSIA